ncbi:hypothetical protein CEXT_725511 [Caerostris extrusa]|uniref:Uncharacterized protein n=1 Tax=Caerostris extrusa TaxID=172846 RepID=A0AAV4Y856_CAEEX|nr:hypothetical protein CEXT_725511 [Caerostris extrusa]
MTHRVFAETFEISHTAAGGMAVHTNTKLDMHLTYEPMKYNANHTALCTSNDILTGRNSTDPAMLGQISHQ